MKLYAEINLQNKIVPLYNSDYDILARVKKNTPLRFEIVQERNYEFHKKVMALYNLGFENQEKINNFDHYREFVTMQAGFYVAYEMDLYVWKKAKSISYANMQQDEFEQLFNRLLDVISKELDTKPEVIRLQLQDFY